jgi:hypothetical protein
MTSAILITSLPIAYPIILISGRYLYYGCISSATVPLISSVQEWMRTYLCVGGAVLRHLAARARLQAAPSLHTLTQLRGFQEYHPHDLCAYSPRPAKLFSTIYLRSTFAGQQVQKISVPGKFKLKVFIRNIQLYRYR